MFIDCEHDSQTDMDERVGEAARLLTAAKHVVVLTGAGISAESGIMTFRGKDGVWEKYDFSKLATLEGFLEDPELVWRWYEDRRGNIADTAPNPAHYALAEMEPMFEGFDLVTQNIDGLHQAAGSTNVTELHGNIWRTRCMGGECPIEENREVPLKELPPMCPCGEMRRPDVVWFGESLPPDALESAMSAAARADLAMTIGTSAAVYPAAYVPVAAKRRGAPLIEVNMEPTPLTEMADVALHGKAGEILPGLVEALKALRAET